MLWSINLFSPSAIFQQYEVSQSLPGVYGVQTNHGWPISNYYTSYYTLQLLYQLLYALPNILTFNSVEIFYLISIFYLHAK